MERVPYLSHKRISISSLLPLLLHVVIVQSFPLGPYSSRDPSTSYFGGRSLAATTHLNYRDPAFPDEKVMISTTPLMSTSKSKYTSIVTLLGVPRFASLFLAQFDSEYLKASKRISKLDIEKISCEQDENEADSPATTTKIETMTSEWGNNRNCSFDTAAIDVKSLSIQEKNEILGPASYTATWDTALLISEWINNQNMTQERIPPTEMALLRSSRDYSHGATIENDFQDNEYDNERFYLDRNKEFFFPINESSSSLSSKDKLSPMWNLTEDLMAPVDVGNMTNEFNAEDINDVFTHGTKDNGIASKNMKNITSLAPNTTVSSFYERPSNELVNSEFESNSQTSMVLSKDVLFRDDEDSADFIQEGKSLKDLDKSVSDEEETKAFGIWKKKAAEISHSFYTKEFQPAWFAKNRHVQTILGALARQEFMYFPILGNLILSKFLWDKTERVNTPDGDFFDVVWKYAKSPVIDGTRLIEKGTYFLEPNSRTPLVLICHGLQSNTDSPLTKDMTIAFNNVGMDVAALNFRGCSGEVNRKPMGYHLSYTDDLEFMVQQMNKQFPGRSIYLSGFSLGANVVTKFLADIGMKAVQEYNICGAAVNAVPFDLTKTQAINDPGFSKDVYGDRLSDSLKERIYDSMDAGVKYNFTREELGNCTTCREFDELVVCSVYDDFENAYDYHNKSSTWDRLDEIMVPEFVMQSHDDPFFAGGINPENNPNMPCRIQYSDYGGHCGFMFHSDECDRRESSFMPTQLARFLEHVHEIRTKQKPRNVALREVSAYTDKKGCVEGNKEPSEFQKLRRAHAANVSQSFQTNAYKPASWARNEHLQTIMGALFRRQSMYVKESFSVLSLLDILSTKTQEGIFWDYRRRMETPDGDFFDVDWKHVNGDTLPSDRPIVLICHGLQSDSRSPLAQDMARAFNNEGMDAACINFRGCSGESNRTPVGYHLGFTEDLKQMIEHVNSVYANRRIYLSGFSLGANVVTACLAELGTAAYDKNVLGAAVNAVPFDMPKANLNLNENGLTKSIYGSRLLESMVARINDSYEQIQFHFPKEAAAKCQTIRDMENLVIAPVFGFRDASDYYERTSTLNKVDQVEVPQFVIQAADDPFFAGQTNPTDDPNRPLRIQLTENGGHCGYVFQSVQSDEPTRETSWMPTELARFLAHVEEDYLSRDNHISHRSLR